MALSYQKRLWMCLILIDMSSYDPDNYFKLYLNIYVNYINCKGPLWAIQVIKFGVCTLRRRDVSLHYENDNPEFWV